jgi:hypothetical protein
MPDDVSGKGVMEVVLDFLTNRNNMAALLVVASIMIALVVILSSPQKIGIVEARITKVMPASMEADILDIIDIGSLLNSETSGTVTIYSSTCLDKIGYFCPPDTMVELTMYRSIFGDRWVMTAVLS